ncbi:MAG: hypothetical protein JNM10_19925, partial [Planctomycetia bacterium]|nr:hypothetical protein [Planctomycetia bacterium]
DAPKDPAKPADGAPAGGPAAKPDEATPKLRALTDAEVAPLLEGLKKALKAKLLSEAAPALDALAGVTHPDLEPALARLLGHNLADVAGRAARALGERAGEKTAATLWKAWSSPANERRVDVRAAILDAFATMRTPLDPKQYGQVERMFTDAATPAAMDAVTRYFTAVATDKRPCKVLALWLDEPTPANVHDGSNPPKEWWEARWKLWTKTRPGAVAALKAITGQEFESSEQARAWFAANRAFGVRW